MIYSKHNLALYDICKLDKEIIGLDSVCFEPDGSTVAINRNTLFIVGPVNQVTRKNFPIEESKANSRICINGDQVYEVHRNITRDTVFGGILENVEMVNGNFKLTDGKSKSTIHTQVAPNEFPEYREILRNAYNVKTEAKVVVNLKRLKNALDLIAKISSGDDTVVFLEFSKKNDIIIRGENYKTNQNIIAMLSSYDRGDEWKELSLWEKCLFGVKSVSNKILKKKKKVIL